MKILYKFLILILIISFIFLGFLPNNSLATVDLNIDSEACILMDADYGKILYEKNSKNIMYPASTTKVMTAILTIENCNLQDKVTVSYWAINSVPATYTLGGISVGQVLTVEQLLNITMIASANDASFVLAEYIANLDNPNYLKDSSQEAKTVFENSIAKFSEMMNNKAKEIGCINTNFVNPNGIHNDNHYSTAYDLALIGKYAYSNSILKNIACKNIYELPENAINNYTTYNSTNALIRTENRNYYQYANGFKTGYTDAAQYCIIATAKKDDMNLLVVILKGIKLVDGTNSRENDCIKLFNYGFEHYTQTSLVNSGDIIQTINISNATDESKSLNLICNNTINCLVEKGEVLDITPVINVNNIFAPISEGQVVGTVTYTIDDIEYSSELIASHDVYSSNFMNLILILLCAFAFLLLLVTILSISKDKKRKK